MTEIRQSANSGPNVFADSPQIAIYKSQKIYGPQIATFAEAPQIFKRTEVRKFDY